ncbi:MAG: hypothetical protein EOO52_03805 [Gammaproteobacteria bacterium]|nr:MAG: hypothetical protein EOO52_03805 [Gammaproteobacteria bacterium]
MMSIIAIVLDPKNEEQAAFSVPVSTERNFEENWLPLIKKLDLEWLPLFQTGVDIESDDLIAISEELSKLLALAEKDLSPSIYKDLARRVNELIKGLEKIFIEKSVTVFIG